MAAVSETVTVVLRLAAFVHEQEGVWLAGCRSLDVYSEGDSLDEAKVNLREAVELWIDSCVERDTLAEALRELGWFRVPSGTSPLSHGEFAYQFTESQEAAPEKFEDGFPLEIEIPAYQAAHFNGNTPGTAG